MRFRLLEMRADRARAEQRLVEVAKRIARIEALVEVAERAAARRGKG